MNEGINYSQFPKGKRGKRGSKMESNRNRYAYLGDVSIDTAKEIMEAFDAVVVIGLYDQYVELGVSSNYSEKVIGMYQLMVQLWDNAKARETVGEFLLS